MKRGQNGLVVMFERGKPERVESVNDVLFHMQNVEVVISMT